ncbi:hypothetical protein Tco_1287753 [Tanacetum coccineum]
MTTWTEANTPYPKDLYTPYPRYSMKKILEDINRGPYSKLPRYAKVNLDNSTNDVLIPLDSWTSGLLVYKSPLSGLKKKSRLSLKNDLPPREKKSLH